MGTHTSLLLWRGSISRIGCVSAQHDQKTALLEDIVMGMGRTIVTECGMMGGLDYAKDEIYKDSAERPLWIYCCISELIK